MTNRVAAGDDGAIEASDPQLRRGRTRTAPTFAYVGHLLRAPSGPPTNRRLRHVTAVVSISSEMIFLAPICTARDTYDDACVLDTQHLPKAAGLRDKSFVEYENLWWVPHAAYRELVGDKTDVYVGLAPPDTLARILFGLRNSRWVSDEKRLKALGEPVPKTFVEIAGERVNFIVEVRRRR